MTALTFVPDGPWTDAQLGELVVADIEADAGEGFRARSYLPYRGPQVFATLDEAKAWVVAVQAAADGNLPTRKQQGEA